MIANALLQRGAEVLRVDENSNTPLYPAVSGNDLDMAKFILENGSDVEFKRKIKRLGIWHQPVLSAAVQLKFFLTWYGSCLITEQLVNSIRNRVDEVAGCLYSTPYYMRLSGGVPQMWPGCYWSEGQILKQLTMTETHP